MVKVHITKLSSNAKTGKMPVTTSEESTCPTTCPFYGGGCYAKSGFHLRTHWQKVSKGERGTDWQGLTDFVISLKPKQVWRHNQAGDMPHVNGHMDLRHLFDLVQANQASGARGYTYTHHLLNTHNKEAIKYANKNGFTINASCESLEQCDEAIDNGIPAVCVVNSDQSQCPETTPAGRKVTICPAQLHDNVTCANCQLCSYAKRSNVVAFLAHGNGKKKVDALLTA